MVVPSASLLVPLTLVASAQIGELTVGAAETDWTTTALEARLTHLPEAVALAVMESLAARVRPVFDQLPLLTVVVPSEVAPALKISIVVPLASLLVPLTTVSLGQSVVVVITGVAETDCTV